MAQEKEVMWVVDVPTKEDFEALAVTVAALETEVAMLTTMVADLQVVPMPQDVKDKLIAVLEWMKANV